jgi:hypothetical protein
MSVKREIDQVEKLMKDEMKDKKRFRKLKEVTIAEDLAAMNTNEATRWNAGNPAVGERLHSNSTLSAKVLYALIFVYVVIVALSLMFFVINGAL